MNDGMIDGQPELGQEGEDPRDLVPQEPDESQIFWAARKGKSFASAVMDKQRAWFETARKSGLLGQWIISYAALHGLDPDSMSTMQTQSLGFDGDEMEFLRLCINIYRPYVQRQVNSVTSLEPTLKARAQNTDAKSQIAAKLGDNIVQGVYKRAMKDGKRRDMVIAASFAGMGFAHLRWDPQGGDMVTAKQPIKGPDGAPLMDPTTQQPATRDVRKKSGAPRAHIGYPWTQFREPDEMDCDSWRGVRVIDNKWNLINTYCPAPQADPATGQVPQEDPEKTALRQRILAAKCDDEFDFANLFGFEGMGPENDDVCTVIHFYYPRSVAIPSGRYAIILGDDILEDLDCPRPEGTPVIELNPSKWIMKTFGYAASWDVLAIQQMLNQIVSDQASNIATFGRQSVAMEKGTEITVDAIATGQKGFFYPQGGKPPTAVLMNDIGNGPTVLQEYLHKMADFVLGENAAARGDPEANVKSGTFAALLHTVAAEFKQDLQQGTDRADEEIANTCLDMVRLYGDTQFIIESVGIDDRTYVDEYTKEDIAGFQGAIVESVPAGMRTYAGILDMFTMLKDFAPEDRAAAFVFLTTGRSEAFMKRDNNSALYIQRENEMLILGKTLPVIGPDGQQVPVAGPDGQPKVDPMTGQMTPQTLPMVREYDNPVKHIPEHEAARQGMLAADNPDMAAVARIEAHITEHCVKYGYMHPFACSFLNIPPPPPQPGTAAFQLACAMAQGQFLISQAGMGAQPGQLAPVPQPQPGQAGSMRPGSGKAGSKALAPDNSTGTAQPAAAGPDSSGVPLPRAANPPPNAQTQQA